MKSENPISAEVRGVKKLSIYASSYSEGPNWFEIYINGPAFILFFHIYFNIFFTCKWIWHF